MRRLLLTAFEPYGPSPENSSKVLLESLRDDPPAALEAWDARFEVLPVDTEAVGGLLDRHLDAHRPDAVVLLGQAPRRNHLELERRARNLRDFRCPDEAGHEVRGAPVVPGGPPELASTLPDLDGVVGRLRAAEIPARVSDDAGEFLCNQALYHCLHRSRGRDPAPGVVFVHLPPLPGQVVRDHPDCPFMPLEMTRRALGICLEAWADPARA